MGKISIKKLILAQKILNVVFGLFMLSIVPFGDLYRGYSFMIVVIIFLVMMLVFSSFVSSQRKKNPIDFEESIKNKNIKSLSYIGNMIAGIIVVGYILLMIGLSN